MNQSGRPNRETTPPTTEGPYYKPNSPQTTDLYGAGVPGEKLTLTGRVLDTNGQPIPGAWLDFWQADGNGAYDNAGYTLRGHQYTDDSGRYTLRTVIPGMYPGRTPHIHVKARANDHSPTLTTQLFIPGAAQNRADPIYRDTLLVEMKDAADGKSATFDFVLSAQ